jgi:DNA gyrase subunit A
MENNQIRKIDIDREMQQSYLDYAMSVIVSRALPDARDGLKPVQRRILYAMHDLGLAPNSAYKKSARIVGEVLGKYHPHGDSAVYEAMARMAQDFSMRCMLVDGQGNFGSVDGDPPAAMRYTEARLTAASIEMLKNIEKNTVEFLPNFDGTLKEPVVLPAQIPNLLVNGATGIAVGMATNIPPHNLGEVVDGCVYMLQNWDKLDDTSVDDLMRFIKGPDFPTGGIILQNPGEEGLASIYGSGKGKVIVQARAHKEEMERGKNRIIVTELPYMVNKSSLIERIADLTREGNLEGVVDLRDESDRHGLRIVIELSKNADPDGILRKLYKHTPMQTTFGIIMLALVNGEPHMLSLKQALKVYLDHRLDVIRRRSEYELEKARQRAHILEGLRIALKYLDEIIALIRNSPDAEEAKIRLMKKYKLTDIQAQAILDMPLRRLAALERKKIEDEYKELMAIIHDLEELLNSPSKVREVCVSELMEARQNYADKRKSQIIGLKEGDSIGSMLTITDVTPSQNVIVAVNEAGLIARTAVENVGWFTGKDAPQWLVRTDTHQTLYLVSDSGKTAAVPVHSIPEAGHVSEGVPLHKVSPLDEEDMLGAIFSLPPKVQMEGEKFVMAVTRGGMVKKSAVQELPGPSSQTFVLCKVNEGDSLGWVLLTDGSREVILATSKGMCIRFKEEEVRPMGLVAAGVNGIKLGVGDELVSAGLVIPNQQVALVCSDGKGKRCAEKEYPQQGRYGQGVIGWKLKPGTRLAGMATGAEDDKVVIHLMKGAPKVKKIGEFASAGRAAGGKDVIEIKPGDQVIELIIVQTGWESAPGVGGEPKPERKPRAKPGEEKAPAAKSKAPVGKTKGKTTRASTAKASAKPVDKPTRGKTTRSKAMSKPSAKKTTAEKKPKAQPAKPAAADKAKPNPDQLTLDMD